MSDLATYTQVEGFDQEHIVQRYATMVKRIAYHLLGRLPNSVHVEDLIQSGMIGLLEAAKNYDPSKGASFETYAGIRIRGNMLDEVRKNDWLPRSVYRNSRLISDAVRELENHLGRDARDVEIAEKMGISLTEYHNMLRDSSAGQLYCFDDALTNNDDNKKGFVSTIHSPMANVERDAFCKKLADCIGTLPERERLVLALYYDEELNLKEIGEVLGVSESRVCQIHSQAMARLESRMPEWRNGADE